jgi:hypothetical protein
VLGWVLALGAAGVLVLATLISVAGAYWRTPPTLSRRSTPTRHPTPDRAVGRTPPGGREARDPEASRPQLEGFYDLRNTPTNFFVYVEELTQCHFLLY